MSTTHMPRPSLTRSERGMISIMTTMVLIIVISLIVLGFAQLSRRNQREALDRQLSTQAFYAAESGINDARNLINTAVANGTTIPDKPTCTSTGGGFYTTSPDIDASAGVRYSCMLVDPSPNVLRYTDVGSTSVIVPVVSADSSAITRVQLEWQSKVTGNPLSGCAASISQFSTTSGWSCGYGVLRFDLVPTAGSLTPNGLANSTMTTFAYPITNAGSNSIGYAASSANPNVRTGVSCTATGCSLSVTGLSSNSYYMRITSMYRNVSLQVRAYNNAGNPVDLEGAQALIDVTGKAQDVLRRIQVSVPLRSSSTNGVSDYAVQSTDSICKRFSVMDNYYSNDVSGVTSGNRLCQP
jgi:Tfp pilus assembly protein PilX